LARALRESVQNFSLHLNRVEADIIDVQEAIRKQARYSAAIREIEMAILELKFSVTRIQEALDVTSVGRLSSVLINPYNLSEILKQVSLQLPAGLTMLNGLSVEDMYVYYTVATVHAIATSTSIRLFIDIPLKAVDRYFELYQVHSFPFFHTGVGKFIMIDEAFTYLAVAENRQFFAIMEPHLLSRCTRNLYTVCPSDVVLRTAGEQNCLIALFLGKMDIVRHKCKRLMLQESFEPIWIRSPDFSYWLYSLSTPQQVTVQCQKSGSPPNFVSNYQVQLKGTGIVPNSSSCYIYAENFKFLPHSLGKTMVNLTITSAILPNIENVLHISEENMLQAETRQPVDLQHLDNLVERATSRIATQGIDVSKTIMALRGREVIHPPSSQLWIVGIVVVIAGLGIIWMIWIMSPGTNYPCIRRLKNKSHVQETGLTDTNIAFQVEAERETRQAGVDRCSQPPAFASREIEV